MIPISLLASEKLASKLATGNALLSEVNAIALASGVIVPALPQKQITLSSAPSDIADKNLQLGYPRVCIYSSQASNTKAEKFRAFSGTVTTIAEVFASANLAQDAEQFIHFYVEGVSSILMKSAGDWGDGFFFPGTYDIHFQPPKSGGLGYVTSAKFSLKLQVSLD